VFHAKETKFFSQGLTLLTAKTFSETAVNLSEYRDGRKARLLCILVVAERRVSTVFRETVEELLRDTFKNTDITIALLLNKRKPWQRTAGSDDCHCCDSIVCLCLNKRSSL